MSAENIDQGEDTGVDDPDDHLKNDSGLLLKIAMRGLSIPDYVKKLKESDILVAIDGHVFRDGPAKLREVFELKKGEEAKWLITLWRDGQVFDLLINAPIESRFGIATEEETTWALEEFKNHVFGDFNSYQNFEIYKDNDNICDVVSLEKDPLAGVFPVLWLLKYRLFPPLGAIFLIYAFTFLINVYFFALAYLVTARFVYLSQTNILRSFMLFGDKKHYMTIAGTNERDVSLVVKRIDHNNRIRYEPHAIKKRKIVHKVIVKDS